MSHSFPFPRLRFACAFLALLGILTMLQTGTVEAQPSGVLVTLGSGTSATTGTDPGPVGHYFQSSRMQFIYTASEINTALSPLTGPRDLVKLGWWPVTNSTSLPFLGYTIKMKHTSATTTSTFDTGPYTTVWTGNYTPTTGGWDTLTLATPFNWDGSSNILVDVCFNITTSWNSSGTSRYYGNYGDMYYYWDDGYNCCSLGAGNLPPYWSGGYKPQVAMRWIPASPMSYISSTVVQPNTTPVTVGYSNQDIIGVKVVTSGSLTPLSLTSLSLSTAGSTSASDITGAKVYYTGNSDVFATGSQFGTTVASPSGGFTVTGTQTLAAGTNHFWLAYDVSATATSGNVLDGQCTSITVASIARTPTVTSPTGSRTIVAPFSGIYTIDPNGTGARNFTSFTAAINQLVSAGVAGPTTFQVAAATYNEKLTILPVTGMSSTNTVTFDGGTGNAATRIISFNTPNWNDYVVQLKGVDYMSFKNLTITSSNASWGVALWLTAQADYNTFSNCILKVSNTAMYDGYVVVGCADPTYPYYYGNWGNYNTFQNNEVSGGYAGFFLLGSPGYSGEATGNKMIGNTITSVYYYGLYTEYMPYFEFTGNTVTMRTGNEYSYGVYGYYPSYSPKVEKNNIRAAYYGLYFYYLNTYNTTGSRAKIVNNMVLTNGTYENYTLQLYYCRDVDVWSNTLNATTNSNAYVMYLYGSSGYNLDVRNNYSVYSGTGTGYLIFNNSSALFTTFNNNAYWTESTSTTSNKFYYGGAYYTSWAALPKTVHNINSVYGEPYFVSNTDLHSRSHVAYQAGQAIAGVTTDIDGDTRGLSPCIGADEYPVPPNEYDMELTGIRFENAATQFAHLADPATHLVKVSVKNIGLKKNPTSLTVVYKLGSAPVDATDGVAQNFTPSWDAANKTALTFSQPITGLTEGSMATVYATVFFTNEEAPNNDTRFSTHEIFGPKVHGYETFEDMAAMVHPPTYDPGYIESDWDVIDNNGGTTLLLRSTDPGTGPRMEVTMYSTTETANEWLISPGAFLIAGSSYRVGFDFHNWGGSPVTIECAFGASPNPASMTTYATFSNIAPGTTLTAKQLAGGIDPYFNTPNFHQPYYLGFRFVTSGTFPYFSLDNVKLDDNPSPPPKIGYGLPGDPIANFIDDPAVPIIMVANYKQPGVINKTFAVANTIDIYGAAGDFLWDVETSTPWLSITKAVPDPTLQNYNLNPPRPRQFQTFTLSADPAGMPAGVHIGEITFYAIMFNNDFPPPNSGLVATNEPFVVPVELRISTAGTKGGATSMTASKAGPLTVPGSPYVFTDPQTGAPIATLHVTSGQIDAMTITCFPNQLPQNLMRMLYVQRYWQISHTGTGWTADITFPYADHEASMILDRYQLRGVRQAVPLAAWEDPIMGTTSTSHPMTNEVSVRGLNPSNIGGNLALAHPYMIATKDGAASVETFGLEQNYPNPFNPSTTIRYAVAEERHVRIAVYNSLGLEVAVPVDDVLPAGRFEVSFDARNLPSGTYVYRMTAGDFVQTRQMTLSK